ncbi:MAG: trigger factor [Oscillospiraceae bacterium]|nr:trigger factor [Oscillospiraceae bacterium]
MNLVSVDTSEKNTATLEIEIDKELFAGTVTKIFRSKAPNLSVPGFRKGKAPRNIIEKLYGKGIFNEEALNELLPEAVEEAVAKSGISPVSKPEIDVKSIDENGVFVTAKYTVKPEVEITNYKGIEVQRTTVTVSEEDINGEIALVQKRNARSLDITDRAAKEGDEVRIDYEGFVDGAPFEGGKGEDHKLKLGAGEFVAGFEEQISGKNIGEEFEVFVTFPEDYHGEDVKGKDAVFKVKLNSIRYEELPELDDEFAKDVSEFDTLEQYKADVGEKIKERNKNRAEYSLEEQLVDGIIANFKADIPDVMIQTETDAQIQEYAYRMQSQGIDMNMYMKYTGMTPESLRAQFAGRAERQVKMRLALEKIAALENISASEEEIEQEYDKMAEMYKLEKDEMKGRMDAAAIQGDLSVRKTVEFLKANANITEIEKSREEFERELKESRSGRDHDHDHGDEDEDEYEDEETEE